MSEVPTEGEGKQGGAADGGPPTAGPGGKVRSETAYPYFGLSHSIRVLQAVRKAGGTEAASADVMREMGIDKVTDRFWSYGVPAAIQFGLIERVGRGETGRIKATELGMRLSAPASPDEERLAKVAAFKTPELYTKLLERLAGSQPSKEGLRNLLYRDYKIVESMAPQAAEAFLDSLKIAELLTPSGSIIATGEQPGDPLAKPPLQPKTEEMLDPGEQVIRVPSAFIAHVFQLRKDMKVTIPLPPDLTTKDVARLHKWLLAQPIEDETPGP